MKNDGYSTKILTSFRFRIFFHRAFSRRLLYNLAHRNQLNGLCYVIYIELNADRRRGRIEYRLRCKYSISGDWKCFETVFHYYYVFKINTRKIYDIYSTHACCRTCVKCALFNVRCTSYAWGVWRQQTLNSQWQSCNQNQLIDVSLVL